MTAEGFGHPEVQAQAKKLLRAAVPVALYSYRLDGASYGA